MASKVRPAPGEPNVELFDVCGRTYRRVVGSKASQQAGSSRSGRSFESDRDFDDRVAESCEAEGAHVRVARTGDGFTVAVDVPESVCSALPGKTVSHIEAETNTRISVPKSTEDRGKGKKRATVGDICTVTVRGSTEAAVVAARTRLELLILNTTEKLSFTHFLCLPISPGNDAVVSSVRSFQSAAVKHGARGLDESILQDPRQLHLTVLMLRLLDDTSVHRAAELLSKIPPPSSDLRKVHLRGLQYLNDDPSEVDVLYIKVAPGHEALAKYLNAVVDAFVGAGLAPPQERPVLLHVTVINTRYRDQQQKDRRESFDAREILKEFSEADFGTATTESIHLSQRGTFSADGFFTRVSSIPLMP